MLPDLSYEERIRLKQGYEDDYAEWEATFNGRGCTCFISPPCSYCTHPGNPMNLREIAEAWLSPLEAAVREVLREGK